jgi:competence protein ComGC
MKKFLALLLILPALVRAEDPDAVCRTHLKHLGGAVKAYQLTHNEKLPAKLSDLYLDGFVDSYADFTCPASGTSITMTTEIDAKSDYELGTGNLLVREKAAHHDGKALAMMNDGSIKGVEGAPAPAPSVAAKPVTATAPATVMRDATPSTPAAPVSVSRETAPPIVKPAAPATDDEPQFTVTKATPGMSFDGNSSFGDFMGVTFAFQADGKLIIGTVKKDSIGEEIGFKAGDEVIEIDHKPAPKGTEAGTVTSEELGKLVGAGDSMLITVKKADGKNVSFSFMTRMPALPKE